jgi:hypothetical protein
MKSTLHGLGAEIVGIAIGVVAGKIVSGVVGGGIEPGRLGAAEAATAALQDIAIVGPETQPVVDHVTAGGACARKVGGPFRVCEMDRRMRGQGVGCHLERLVGPLGGAFNRDRARSSSAGEIRTWACRFPCRMLTKVSCIADE